MKLLSTLLIAAIIAFGVSSCADPLDIFDELDTSGTTDTTDKGVSYKGLTVASLGDSTTFSSYKVDVEIEEANSAVTITMCDIQFSDDSPSFELLLSNIKGSSSVGKYTTDSIIATNLRGMVHEDLAITNISIQISSDSLSISFSVTYEGDTYNVKYSGEADS